MPFEEKKQKPLLEGVLGRAHVTILGTIGLRLSASRLPRLPGTP